MTERRGRTPLSKDIYFAQIPEWVLFHEDLSPQAVRLYCVLARFSEGRAWPGRQLLAERLQAKSTKTVDRALKDLVDVGAITVIPRWDEAGDRTSNAYKVHVAPPEGVASRMSPPPDTDVPTGGDIADATGRDADVPVERATFRTTPQPPASGGPQLSDEPAKPATCTKPGTQPHPNCRGCGTTARQLEAARKRDDADTRRLASIAQAKAEREARAATRPPPEHTKSRVNEVRALLVRSTP